jgi:hypothetical protein
MGATSHKTWFFKVAPFEYKFIATQNGSAEMSSSPLPSYDNGTNHYHILPDAVSQLVPQGY